MLAASLIAAPEVCAAAKKKPVAAKPVAAKTACAFVMGVYGGSKDAMGKAQAAFEGGFGKSGEYTGSPALQRVFNSFEDVEADLQDWATRLYEPMFKAAKVIHLNADSVGHAEGADA